VTAAIARGAVAALALAITGCPTTYGLRAGVYAAPPQGVEVVALDGGGGAGPGVTAVAGARLACDRCGDRRIEVGADGWFAVSLDGDRPVVLHVTAPGYLPVDVTLSRAPPISQAGPASIVIVLAPVIAPVIAP